MTYHEKFKAFLASALKFDSEEKRNQGGGAMGCGAMGSSRPTGDDGIWFNFDGGER